MKTLIISLNIFFICYTLSGQSDKCRCSSGKIDAYEPRLSGLAYFNTVPGMNEQYLSYWTPGNIYLTNNEIVKNKKLRYNGLQDELLWLRDSDFQTAVLDRNTISRFTLLIPKTSDSILFERVNEKDPNHQDHNDMYLQVLADGKVKLYKKFEVTYYPIQNILVRKNIFYLFIDGKYNRFKPNRTMLFRLFESDKKTIKHIVWSNNLIIKKETDLIKAIELYNQQVLVNQ